MSRPTLIHPRAVNVRAALATLCLLAAVSDRPATPRAEVAMAARLRGLELLDRDLKTCETCRTLFLRPMGRKGMCLSDWWQTRFCSLPCSRVPRPEARKPREPKPCAFCGASFVAPGGPQRHQDAVYCSRACSNKRGPFAERFWARVDRSAGLELCWPWTGGKRGSSAYGGLHKDGERRQTLAHRVAFELVHGDGSAAGLFVCHRCDNPPCCNPAHLFLGTNLDNTRDRDAKGRNVNYRGEEHGRALMTEAAVVDARRRLSDGVGLTLLIDDLVEKFNVTRSAARRALHGHTWAHLPC